VKKSFEILAKILSFLFICQSFVLFFIGYNMIQLGRIIGSRKSIQIGQIGFTLGIFLLIMGIIIPILFWWKNDET